MKSIIEIFFVFMKIGTLTFGGGYTMLPMLQNEAAERRDWVSREEIADYYAIAQCLPGIIAVNAAMLIGHRRKGFAGMTAAALGMVFPSLVIILIIAMFIQNILEYEAAAHAFNGIRVAVLVLIISAAIKMWKSGVKDICGLAIFIVSLAVLAFADISPVFLIIAGALCGIIIKEIRERNRK